MEQLKWHDQVAILPHLQLHRRQSGPQQANFGAVLPFHPATVSATHAIDSPLMTWITWQLDMPIKRGQNMLAGRLSVGMKPAAIYFIWPGIEMKR
jgi:hypothetical protein